MNTIFDGDGGWFSAFDGTDLLGGLLLIVAGIAIALILVPILLFGFEFVIAGVLLAAGLVGRTALGKPWTVEARALDGSDRVVRSRISGWRWSKKLIDQLRSDLAAGLEPAPESGVPDEAAA